MLHRINLTTPQALSAFFQQASSSDAVPHFDAAKRIAKRELPDERDAHCHAVSPVECDEALRALSPILREAFDASCDAINAYQRTQRAVDEAVDMQGVSIRRTWHAVQRVGIVIDGNVSDMPSVLCSVALPARIAGVQSIAATVVADDDNRQRVRAVASLCGIEELVETTSSGVVSAVRAYAGTGMQDDVLHTVDCLVGVGGTVVQQTLQSVAGFVRTPVLSVGKATLVLIVDETTDVLSAVTELLAHGMHANTTCALVTWSEETCDEIERMLQTKMQTYAESENVPITNCSSPRCYLVEDAHAAMNVTNILAPTILLLMTVDPESLIPLVQNTGVILTGNDTPQAFARYFSGLSSVVPLGRSARYSGVLHARHFMHAQEIVTFHDEALRKLSPLAIALADADNDYLQVEAIRSRKHSVS